MSYLMYGIHTHVSYIHVYILYTYTHTIFIYVHIVYIHDNTYTHCSTYSTYTRYILSVLSRANSNSTFLKSPN